MFQQFIALIMIIFFLSRLFLQKKKKEISLSEFIFWLAFWIFAALAIVFIKWIDRTVAVFGFSARGIEVLFYFGMVIMFYFIFRLRIHIEKIERDITKITREISLKE
ncbi:MAG: DUF2304 family protein [bacterium]